MPLRFSILNERSYLHVLFIGWTYETLESSIGTGFLDFQFHNIQFIHMHDNSDNEIIIMRNRDNNVRDNARLILEGIAAAIFQSNGRSLTFGIPRVMGAIEFDLGMESAEL